jgi:hypothetical protein
MRRAAGPFSASAEIVAAKSDSALLEFMKELNGIRQSVPADELSRAKRYLQLQLPGNFETSSTSRPPARSGRAVRSAAGLLQQLRAERRGCHSGRRCRVAQQYINPGSLAVVIVGDRKTIEQGLKATMLGRSSIRDMTGKTDSITAMERKGMTDGHALSSSELATSGNRNAARIHSQYSSPPTSGTSLCPAPSTMSSWPFLGGLVDIASHSYRHDPIALSVRDGDRDIELGNNPLGIEMDARDGTPGQTTGGVMISLAIARADENGDWSSSAVGGCISASSAAMALPREWPK